MTDHISNWVLRIEGINFDDTVYNTTDLSTIRGSSLALEAIGYEIEALLKQPHQLVQFEKVYIGGSQAVFRLIDATESSVTELAQKLRDHCAGSIKQGDDWPVYVDPGELAAFENFPPDEQLRLLETPSEHMTFAVDVERIDGAGDAALKIAINKAHMRSRRRQMRAPNLPRSPGATATSGKIADRAALRCPIDKDRQTSQDQTSQAAPDLGCTLVVNQDRFPNAVACPDAALTAKGLKRIYASKRTADLRPYGRDARRTLYAVQIGVENYRALIAKGLFVTHDFARTFEDITAEPPKGLAPSVPGKLAYVYLDGNGFSKIRDAADFAKFAQMCDAITKAMLTGLLNRFLDESANPVWSLRRKIYTRTERYKWGQVDRQLMRLETLIFGGEDACLVMPAWLAFDVTSLMLKLAGDAGNAAVATWGLVDPPKISFRAGVLICDARTPARRAVDVAKTLCDDARIEIDKVAQSAISFHISESHDLPEYPGAMLEALRGPQFGTFADQATTNTAFRATMADWHIQERNVIALKNTFARSQLYALIQELDGDQGATLDQPARFDKFVKTYLNRKRDKFNASDLRDKLPCDPGLPLVLRLKVLAELLDYVDPFKTKTTEGTI